MTQLMAAFDPSQFDPTQGAGQLPVGRHKVIIENEEIKANSNNDGGYLQFNLRVIDGPQTGTGGAYRLNLYHNNPKTVEIANKQLSAICHVTNVFRLGADGRDPSVLRNIPFFVDVAPQKGENADKYTEITKVYDVNGNEPRRAGQGAANAQPQGAAQGGFGGQQQQPAQGQGGFGGQQQQPQQNPQGQGNGQPQWGGQQGGAQGQPQQNPQGGAQGGWAQGGQGQPQGQGQGGTPAWGGQGGGQQQPAQGGQGGGWAQNQGGAQGGQPSWGQR